MKLLVKILRKFKFFLGFYILLPMKLFIARIIFFLAYPAKKQLSYSDLTSILKKRSKLTKPPRYGYSNYDMYCRGFERAKYILNKSDNRCHKFLELACGDGNVLLHLSNLDKETTGLDILDWRSKLVKESNARFVKRDVSRGLPFRDSAFDFAFSYAAFEHFPDPEFVLLEMLRVTRPKGLIYLNFGPLWLSPDGLHNIGRLNIPYIYFLFSEDIIRKAVYDFGLETEWNTDYAGIIHASNKYSYMQFRTIWERQADKCNILLYKERRDLSELSFIFEYASLLKAKTKDFNDLIISEMEILLEKK